MDFVFQASPHTNSKNILAIDEDRRAVVLKKDKHSKEDKNHRGGCTIIIIVALALSSICISYVILKQYITECTSLFCSARGFKSISDLAFITTYQ